ncbi:uncharacterized protein LOC110433326 isoform X1 [Sorghum bicolor]|uniref:uncharacterized protein LOC110433326 isoform X1 n=1 Tax=Sorghum bicolor TaxID=4558 RepID=UPI000B424A8F|nr:uncharacterized protein LOC110433326 isoform X1 [Sorghum bicolor]|eukprot:XP_021310868.1 uncharacterized protein LOC110433326 isoform X1 [Sorghum bicolor]
MRFLYSGLLVAIEANGSAATKESGGGRGSGPGILHLRVHGPAMSLSPSPSRPAPLAADSDACELRVNFPAFFWHDASESCLPQQVALNLLRWSLSITPCERASERGRRFPWPSTQRGAWACVWLRFPFRSGWPVAVVPSRRWPGALPLCSWSFVLLADPVKLRRPWIAFYLVDKGGRKKLVPHGGLNLASFFVPGLMSR